jgi:transposase
MEAKAVIGVDTHKDSHSAALLNEVGALQASVEVVATAKGYQELLKCARSRECGGRVWVVEGTGSYGAGLCAYLLEQGELVYEGDHPKRPSRGPAGKSDYLDAIWVAREALSRVRHGQPKQRAEREMLRVLMTAREGAVNAEKQGLNQLYAMVVSAPEGLRGRLGRLQGAALVRACLQLRPGGEAETRLTAATLRSVARRVRGLSQEAADYEKQIRELVKSLAPALLAERGVGPLTAAQVLLAWSHAGRIHSESAFAKLAGVAPLPASSGRVQRHRLNRLGDRQLNRALHLVAITRARCDERTQAYVARRTAEGKSHREIRRCLKRYIARRLFRLLEGLDRT